MMDRVFRTAVLLAFAFSSLGPLSVSAADDAASLLAKHRAYVGWTGGDGSVKTLRETGEATRDDKVVGHLRTLRLGLAYRSSGSMQSGSYDDGFTGRVFWQSNANGFTIQTVGETVKYLVSQLVLGNEEIATLAGTIRREETVDGVKTIVVRVTPESGLPIDLSIDPQTGALRRYVIDPDGKYETRVDVLDYTDLGGGKRVVSSWRYGGEKTVYRWTSVELNKDVSPDELRPPKQTASWTFGPQSETVPIDVTEKSIYVDALVNGQKGHFLLDTGAGMIAFTDSFARRAGAKRVGATDINGVGGSARANVYRVDTIAFGSSVLRNVVVLTGLDEATDTGERYDGLIGFDFLAAAIVELNLDDKTLRILDPAAVQLDQNKGIVVRVDLTSGQPRVPMTIAGRVAVLATLDSGNSFYVLFSHELIGRDHVSFFQDPTSLGNRIQFYGVNGSEIDRCGQLQSLELGPIAYRPVPACTSDSFAHNEVLLGFDFVKAFNYVFDYPDGEILMTARQGSR